MAGDKTRQNVTRKQQAFLDLILSGQTIKQAAASCGISRMTAYRWLRLPAVQNALQEAQGELLAQAMRRLLALQERAIGEFTRLLDDTLTPAGTRLQAAKVILDAGLRYFEANELTARIEALEKAVTEITSKTI